MPTFSDMQAQLAGVDDDLARSMTLFTRGTVGDLFNHPSNISVDNPLLALDLSALLRANDEVRLVFDNVLLSPMKSYRPDFPKVS